MENKLNIFITLSGVSGSGKTTLAKYVANKYKIDYIQSTSRQYMNKILKSKKITIKELINNKKEYYKFQDKILKKYIDILKRYITENKSFIIDRCYIDYLVYTEMFLSNNHKQKLFKKYMDDINFIRKNTIQIFIKPINNSDRSVYNDNIRKEIFEDNKTKKIMEYEIFNKYIDMYDYIIDTDNFNKRKKIMNEIIFNYNLYKKYGNVIIQYINNTKNYNTLSDIELYYSLEDFLYDIDTYSFIYNKSNKEINKIFYLLLKYKNYN